jgi:hypothetical protein
MKYAAAALAGIVTASAGCNDISGPRGASILLSDMAGVTDTIEALLPEPVTFQVRNANGTPAADTWVRLRPDALDDLGNRVPDPSPKVYMSSGQLWATLEDALANSSQPSSDSRRVLTDSRGRAVAYVRLGRTAGDVYLKAAVDEYRDSVAFHALPGAPVALDAVPADTAVLAGDSYQLTVFAVDRRGNRRSEVDSNVTAVSSEPHLVQTDGATVEAESIGRAAIDLTHTIGSGRVHVSVVPSAVLAVVRNAFLALTLPGGPAAPDSAPALMAADGFTPEPITGIDTGACPAWHPSGDRLLFDGLRIVAAGGEQTRISTGNPDLVAGCGRFSPDGEWIYFEGRLSTEPQTASQIWRIQTDGTGLQQITTAPQISRARGASPSPDGSRIVYTMRGPDHDDLVVYTLATGVADTIMEGRRYSVRASWSPTGEWIAYTHYTGDGEYEHEGRVFVPTDRIALIRPDGTDDHDLPSTRSTDNHFLLGDGGVEWSTDGEWLVGSSAFPDLRIKLINITDGQTVPLNGATRGYAEPVWKP